MISDAVRLKAHNFGLVAGLLLALFASPQSTDPKLSDASHAKIRDIQLQQKNLENQYMQLQQQLVNLKTEFDSLNEQLKTATESAYKEAGAKREDWTLDLVTLKFTKIEKKAEAKK